MRPSSKTEEDFTLANDPDSLFEAWFEEADRSELNDANAMTLATAGADGMPNARMVLLKGADARGFTFYTNCESAKGKELLSSHKAALCFHWKSLRRQVRVRGHVEQVPAAEADAYYTSRGRGSQIGAWASQQSRPLPSRAALEEKVAEFEKEFSGIEPVRPRYWLGFRVVPVAIEFWQDRPHRLHDRIVFGRENRAAPWTKTRLYP